MSAARRAFAAVLAVVVVSVACPKSEAPFVPVVTTIVVSPGNRAFTALTLTQQFSATVQDQRGTAMTGQAVVWGTSNGSVASVSGSGLATAQGVGSANITATIGTVVGQASVTVTQTPSQLFKFDGDGQSGNAGAPLPIPLTARVLDAGGFGVPGVTVNFAASGGGSVGTPSATSNAQGQASTSWTLGTSGAQTVTASSAGVTSVIFSATVLAGAADTIIKQTTDGQSVPAGTAVNPAPAVLVRDQFGNPVSGLTVNFAITQGGGLLTGASATTNASGIATVGSWIVGTAGAQSMTATAVGAGIGANPITFNVTSLAPGAATSIIVFDGNNQTGLQNAPVNIPPAARVRDASNNPVQGASVTFAVTAGGGSVTGGTTTTDLQGIARVGSWTIQSGGNTLQATTPGVGGGANFSATGVASTFNITVRYVTGTNPTAAQSAAFDSAAARWSRVIIGDLADFTGQLVQGGGNPCGRTEIPNTTETIDDVLIFAMLVPIDGVNGILGSAGPCSIRLSNSLTIYGLMRFDTADLTNMESNGTLRDVILHEMGHVLGLGTLWATKGLITGAGTLDPFFTGAQANQKFDDIGGDTYTGGGTVPVENCVGAPPGCGAGTRDGHWREFGYFENELMTGYIDIPAPMSVVTPASFADMGYLVNYSAADAFSLSFPLRALRASAARGVHLGDDIYRTPILVVDNAGRVVRVIQPQ